MVLSKGGGCMGRYTAAKILNVHQYDIFLILENWYFHNLTSTFYM